MSDVFFVGCGPGDPELITVKAKKLIQKADVIVYSGSLIPEPILKLCKKGKSPQPPEGSKGCPGMGVPTAPSGNAAWNP